MAEIVMPRLSDSMEEGTILQWLKELGDEVAVGDAIVKLGLNPGRQGRVKIVRP